MVMSDVSVCMGIGAEQAKKNADILILDDNFASISNIFDVWREVEMRLQGVEDYYFIIKQSMIIPIALAYIFNRPTPLNINLILLLDVMAATVSTTIFSLPNHDIGPNGSESPRVYPATDSLRRFVPVKSIGFLHALAGLFVFRIVLASYGFRDMVLSGMISNNQGIEPLSTDHYNPNLASNGNSNYQFGSAAETFPFDAEDSGTIDVRLFYTWSNESDWRVCQYGEDDMRYFSISKVTGESICYTTEALVTASSACLFTYIVLSWLILPLTISRTGSICDIKSHVFLISYLSRFIIIVLAFGIMVRYKELNLLFGVRQFHLIKTIPTILSTFAL